MPCIGGPSWDTQQQLHVLLERMEPMLCSACRALERLGYDFEENPELSQWWDKHKKEDARRQAAERKAAEKEAWERRVIAAALLKPIGELTKEEKTLLKKHNFM